VGSSALLAMATLAAQPGLRAALGEAARQTAARFTNAAFFARVEAVMVSVTGKG
jgi:hypothetical protein